MIDDINWTEYDAAAEWCAARGLTGRSLGPGMLPANLSEEVRSEITEFNDEFRARVRECAYAIAMEKYNLPEGE